jgi:hypothetical protein
MDQATELSMRLKQYAAALTAAGLQQADDYSIEQWLGFWDEDDSVFGNVGNIEHWLSQSIAAKRSASAP